ncbi:hypothetical protein QVD17_10977 [Tagetes erecta]|uniref:Zinc finger C2H2 LYAR-type domain-containing protein n=1 Tax=Tagetes erecta TaxID=13708 RepID=A0AAD8P6F1_TARER|nr:hypothetical protein QVD17_10977 [Tagetes erecta]
MEDLICQLPATTSRTLLTLFFNPSNAGRFVSIYVFDCVFMLLDLFSLSIVQCLRHRVSTTTRDLNLLESMAFDTVSLEELLGHYNEIYKKNESDIVEIEDRLSAFCIWLRSCCGDNLKKPKLAGHFRSCSANTLPCIDCGQMFGQQSVQGHTQCITEMEKYGLKGQAKPSNGTPGKPNSSSKSKPEVDINVGLSERPPWFCRYQ